MSYGSVIQRAAELRQRLGMNDATGVRMAPNRNFAKVLQTANNRFTTGPARYDVPANATAPTAPTAPTASGRAGALAASSRSVAGAVPGLDPKLRTMIDAAAARNGVPPGLVMAVTRAESGFKSDAVSPAGATGLMQLMPATARGLGVTDSFDPQQNLMGGAKYLRQMLDRFHGDAELALAGYNAGPGNVDRYGGIPPFTETRNYVARVLGYAEEFGWKP